MFIILKNSHSQNQKIALKSDIDELESLADGKRNCSDTGEWISAYSATVLTISIVLISWIRLPYRINEFIVIKNSDLQKIHIAICCVQDIWVLHGNTSISYLTVIQIQWLVFITYCALHTCYTYRDSRYKIENKNFKHRMEDN